MTDDTPCPVCGQGPVTSCTDSVEIEYLGSKAMVPLHYAVCSACTSDFAGPEQALLNKKAVLAFRS
jgi:HTH-type transcriptional regulator / antitoxin MqsA